MKRLNRLLVGLAGTVCMIVSHGRWAQAGDIQAVERSTLQNSAESVSGPSPKGATLLCVPVMAPGQPAFVTVQDSLGHAVVGVSVLVNGQPCQTNLSGQASFTVPNAGAVVLSLVDQSRATFETKNYALLSNGSLTLAGAAPLIERILAAAPARVKEPILLFAPLVIESGQVLAVIGTGLNADANTERLSIDGLQSEVLSGSSMALLVRTPVHLSIGPMKDLFVSSKNGESSNVMEVDVAHATGSFKLAEGPPGKSLIGCVAVQGTSLPVLIEVTNDQLANMQFGTNKGVPVSDQVGLMAPGGEQNFVPVNIPVQSQGALCASAHLLSDTPELLGQEKLSTLRAQSMLQAVELAQLTKLKKRLIAVEAHIIEDRQQRNLLASTADLSIIDKLSAGLRALSLRQSALSTMVNARKAVYESSGGSEQGYQQALDQAGNGAYYVLERAVGSVVVIPLGSVVCPGRPASQVAVRAAVPQKAPGRMAEPAIKLLVPLGLDVISATTPSFNLEAPLPGTQEGFTNNFQTSPLNSIPVMNGQSVDAGDVPTLPVKTVLPALPHPEKEAPKADKLSPLPAVGVINNGIAAGRKDAKRDSLHHHAAVNSSAGVKSSHKKTRTPNKERTAKAGVGTHKRRAHHRKR